MQRLDLRKDKMRVEAKLVRVLQTGMDDLGHLDGNAVGFYLYNYGRAVRRTTATLR